MEFFQTKMGHAFYEGTVPALVRELRRLNDNIERGLTLMEHKGASGDSESVSTEKISESGVKRS